MSCPSLEIVAAWILGELSESEADAFEEHYFGCDVCLERAEGMERLVGQLGASVPFLLTPERRRALEPKCRTTVPVEVGAEATIHLGPRAELGFWVMRAPLEQANTVDIEARDANGALLFAFEDVPFDRERGEVVLACQSHYRALHADGGAMRVRLMLTGDAGKRPVGDYVLHHVFESA